jgi:leucyl-tRNA synthetase
MEEYKPYEIEQKWQKKWAEDKLYHASDQSNKPKWYALTMFPYTSGDLHIGHWYAMAPADAYARFKRMQGYNVLHPMGFDAFGLPAENAAIKRGIHPREWTLRNIENMRRQLKSIGAIYDWDREVITCLPEYYRWTQWFFLKLYRGGLAYRAKAPVNWCPSCQTVLANEQVLGGLCERCSTQVVRRDLEQWFFRITKYAEELLNFDGIDWPEKIKLMQRNWIGKSEGAIISFPIEGLDQKIEVFTTRPDTILGATFLVLAPEHPLVEKLTSAEQEEAVRDYIEKTRRHTEIERLSTEKEKDGVFTGSYAINPLNNKRLPIWIADYVLLSYGTGAIMAVPAHDERDFTFARKYGLDIEVVIAPPEWDGETLENAYAGEGAMINSGKFNGLASEKGKEEVIRYIEENGLGKKTVSYKLRDWLISRQRYWGAPIPIIYCPKCGIVPVPEKDLPVLLPENAKFKPTGESPLKYVPEFVNTTCPNCGSPAERETDTMDTFMCSSWYFLRYTSPHYDKGPFDPEKVKLWMPVDIYTGGAEHAVMHLLYARFFIKAIRDLGLINLDEPFKKLFNQGTIIAQRQKMSKSRGNVVTPDPYVSELGADTVRTYLMFLGPWEEGGEWQDRGINGVHRWLKRIWALVLDEYIPKEISSNEEIRRLTHKVVKRVTQDIEEFHFNTAIAALMEFSNTLRKVKDDGSASLNVWDEALKTLLLLLAPFAPHITEELWAKKGYPYSIHNQSWPQWDESLVREEEVTIVVQINGKLRDSFPVPAGLSEEEIKRMAQERPKVKSRLDSYSIIKTIYVPQKLVNFVTG